jgi:hypothetical protein
MKHLLSVGVFAIFSLNLVGQTNPQTPVFKKSFLDSAAFNGWEYKDSLKAFDLGMLWTQKDNSLLLAFIGKHYQRMRVKILSATKDPADPFTYTISGKCMLRDTVRLFAGTVKIIAGRTLRQKSTGLDEDSKQDQGGRCFDGHLSSPGRQQPGKRRRLLGIANDRLVYRPAGAAEI